MRFVKQYCRAVTLALATVAFPAGAQTFEVPSGQATSATTSTSDPSDQLATNLMILSQRPRDVNALIGAGLSAIAIGDGNAALGFLARAEEISPSNGRIKAALGSALLLVERPAEALKLFGEASALGVPDRELARDRGLAFDLRGDTRRAQRDYLMALEFNRDDEVIRRLALSYGISGERDRALNLLDPLLQKQDQAAWRARAFVLAMNGDLRGAESIAGSVMPPGSSATMTPFLRRLSSLNAAERALAVNFGMIASDGQQLAQVQTNDPFRAASTSSGAGQRLTPTVDPFVPRPAAAKPPVQIASNVPRRRPGQGDSAFVTPKVEVATLGSERVGKRIGPADPALSQPKPTQVAVVKGATSLPPPDSVTERAGPGVSTGTAQPSFSSIFIAAKDVVPATIAVPRSTTAPLATPPLSAATARPSAPMPFPTTTPPPARFEVPPITQPVRVVTVQAPAPVASAPTASASIASAPTAQASLAKAVPDPAPLTPTVPAAIQSAQAAVVPVVPTPVASTIVTPNSALAPSINTAPAAQIAPVQVALATPSPALPSVSPASSVMGPPDIAPAVPSVPVVTEVTPPAAQIAVVEPAQPAPSGLGAIIASIEPEAETTAVALPSASERRAIRVAVSRKAEATAKADLAAKLEKEEREAARAEAAKNPARIWVQVAGGANKAGLSSTWKKTRDAAPAALKATAAWTTPLNRTNRLLVGPFKSNGEARDMVNKLNKAGLSVFAFTSSQGQAIEKLGSR